jgi:hypothetical protein
LNGRHPCPTRRRRPTGVAQRPEPEKCNVSDHPTGHHEGARKIFLAQFVGDAPPSDSFDAICGWAAGLGYKGVQVPTSDPRLIDLGKAAASQAYCDEIAGVPETTITKLKQA